MNITTKNETFGFKLFEICKLQAIRKWFKIYVNDSFLIKITTGN
jgi:hypothetical protein